MTNEKEMVNVNDELLQSAQMMAAKHNGNQQSTGPKLAQMKISYDPHLVPQLLGKWVVGQNLAYVEGTTEIISSGEEVVKFIPLQAFSQYSLYQFGHPDLTCSSAQFKMSEFNIVSETLTGNNHGYLCGKKVDKMPVCPYRQEGSRPKCGCQMVVYGIAITKDGEEVPCRTYLKSKSYFAFSTFLFGTYDNNNKDAATHYVSGGGEYNIPIYGFEVELGAVRTPVVDEDKKPVPGKFYFVPSFKRGDVFAAYDGDRLSKYSQMAEEINQYVVGLNIQRSAVAVDIDADVQALPSNDTLEQFSVGPAEQGVGGMDDVPFDGGSNVVDASQELHPSIAAALTDTEDD